MVHALLPSFGGKVAFFFYFFFFFIMFPLGTNGSKSTLV